MISPKVTWKCEQPPRSDRSCPAWLTATEFQDHEDVARAKVRQLAELLRLSRKTVLYTGAGISASVVGQAARGGGNGGASLPRTNPADQGGNSIDSGRF